MTRQDNTLGRQIRQRRKALGLTQREVAAMMGIHHQQISLTELGRGDTKLSSLEQIGRALGLQLVLTPDQSAGSVLEDYGRAA